MDHADQPDQLHHEGLVHPQVPSDPWTPVVHEHLMSLSVLGRHEFLVSLADLEARVLQYYQSVPCPEGHVDPENLE